MATTVHEPPRVISPEDRLTEGRQGGGGRNLAPAGGSLRALQDDSSPASRTGIWVIMASITMTFLAFTSAMVVRQGSSLDWRHLELPRILYLNTVILLASSLTLEMARRRYRTALFAAEQQAGTLRALYATLALGLLFIAGQYIAWLQLKAEGLYLATNPSSSFFYLLTAVHGLHVLGGLAGITYVISKLRRGALRRGTLSAASHYWHFMDLLWIYLLSVLWMKL
jgi:cytochrome c oxidase subunit III